MIRLLADESFDGRLIRGLLQRDPRLDLIRAQDAGLAATRDQDILAWAAREGRVLLTRDVRTMVQFAYERVSRGALMPGVVVVSESVPLALAIEQIQILAGASQLGEWEGRVLYLPF